MEEQDEQITRKRYTGGKEGCQTKKEKKKRKLLGGALE